MTKSLIAALAVTIGCMGAAEIPGTPAKAGYCWYETAWYEKWNCSTYGQTSAGKYILVCCN